MSYSEPPFGEYEERYLLAEILKRSSFPTQALFAIIRDAQIDPQWTEIALPYGRSVSSCQQAFNVLATRTAQDPQSAYPIYRRPLANPDLERANAAGRELQPRPPLFPGNFNPPTGPAGYSFSTLEPPPRKKRGRPNKEEFERRAAEARARGEEYPKRRAKAQKRSAGDTNKDSPSKASESVDSPTDSRAGGPASVLSPEESGPTSTSQSAIPFPLNSPQSNQEPGSVTSMSEDSSGGRGPQTSGHSLHHAQPHDATGSLSGILHPSFPNQETGYGFSIPGMAREYPRPPQQVQPGGPSVPHSSSGLPPRDPYGYQPGTTLSGFRHEGHSRPGT